MKYCIKCGSELRGAKNFCMICGTRQEKAKKGEKPIPDRKVKSTEIETGSCVKCGDETDRKCFFCDTFVCRDHYFRMQANVLSYPDMQAHKTQDESKRINEGWRGFITFACQKCVAKKDGKELSEEETAAISTLDECSWYKLDQ